MFKNHSESKLKGIMIGSGLNFIGNLFFVDEINSNNRADLKI